MGESGKNSESEDQRRGYINISCLDGSESEEGKKEGFSLSVQSPKF